MKEYEERAVSLALNKPKLQSLTNRLKAFRMTCPLFDTQRWVSLNRSFIFATTVLLFRGTNAQSLFAFANAG
jgi:hypothetical protein